MRQVVYIVFDENGELFGVYQDETSANKALIIEASENENFNADRCFIVKQDVIKL
jgi:hypothetical protein